MQNFEKSKIVNAEPDQVFEFLSDIDNLSQYLPTVRHAEHEENDRIRIQGEAGGHKYDDTGFFRADEDTRRMEWGSDSERGYQGWLTVEESGNNQSEVKVHLSFGQQNHALKEMDQRTGDHVEAINEGIENALKSIKNLCEGIGGKVESVSQR